MLYSKKGYSLIELSLVITVISFLIHITFSVGVGYIDKIKYDKTLDKLNLIEESLKSYVKTNGHLPCPSSGSLPNNHAKFGVGVSQYDPLDNTVIPSCNGTDESVSITRNGATIPAETFSRGMIPIRSLGLADDVAYDGWGRRITYMVDNRFVVHRDFVENSQDNIHLYTSYNLNDLPFVENAVMALISHGKSGHGAWNKEGTSRLTTVTNNALRDRYNADSIFQNSGSVSFEPNLLVMNKNYLVPGDENSVFDDIVRFKLFWQFEAPKSVDQLNDIRQMQIADAATFDAEAQQAAAALLFQASSSPQSPPSSSAPPPSSVPPPPSPLLYYLNNIRVITNAISDPSPYSIMLFNNNDNNVRINLIDLSAGLSVFPNNNNNDFYNHTRNALSNASFSSQYSNIDDYVYKLYCIMYKRTTGIV